MIYTPLTKKAMCLAYRAHHGQVDKVGVPYIFHPLHLAQEMDEELSCCAALLHDVVEDTDVTLEQLRQDFPEAVVRSVALLTHDPAVDYFDYIRAIRTDPIAKKVKLADLAHNSDRSHLAGADLPPEQIARWQEKYAQARALLTQDTPAADGSPR